MIRGLKHLSYEGRLRVDVVQHGEEKAPGRPSCTFRGPTRKMGTNILAELVAVGQGKMALSCKRY